MSCPSHRARTSFKGFGVASGRYIEKVDFAIAKTDDEWREELAPDRYAVLRRSATEAPFTGSLLHVDADGHYSCAGCGQRLFNAAQKFDSGTGWPSFDACEPGTVVERSEGAWLFRRTEILCSRCGGHLGHVFNDGPAPTGRRYCVNSLAIDFTASDD